MAKMMDYYDPSDVIATGIPAYEGDHFTRYRFTETDTEDPDYQRDGDAYFSDAAMEHGLPEEFWSNDADGHLRVEDGTYAPDGLRFRYADDPGFEVPTLDVPGFGRMVL